MESEVKYGDKTMTNSIYHGKKGDNSNWLNKILHWNLLGQYQPIILRDLT
jgi:hypothetical protein